MAIKYSLLKSFPASPGIDSSADIPLTNNVIGDQLYVAETNRLYIWNGSGWYNIALINTAPTITNGANASYALATDGTPTVITLTATDPEGIPITWSYAVTSGSLGSTATITQADNVFTITPSTNTADAGTFGVTFTASDGVNTATSTTSLSLQFTAAAWSYAIFSSDQNTAGTTNNSFVDRSTNALTVTPGGTPYQASFHPYLENWSVDFDGTNADYIRFDNSTNALYSSNNDITIECWIYPRTSVVTGIFDGSSGVSDGLRQYRDNRVGKQASGTDYDVAFTITPYKWQHFAFVADSTNWRVYIDGVQQNTITSTTYTATNTFDIGTINAGANGKFNGYISDFRITKSSVYTSNFTPPLRLEEITNTTLLACNSNRFINHDTSYSGTITVNSNPTISAFNPFGQESETLIGSNKGSVYLDGNADYLTSATSAVFNFSTDPFTVSLWAYPEVVSDNDGLILIGSLHLHLYLGSWTLGTAGSGGTAIATAKINTWTHLAIERDAGNINLYIDGTLAGSVSSTTLSASSMIVGYYYASAYAFQGYLSDIKVVNGTAVYGGNFTPPTAPTGNTNAVYYLPMDNPVIANKAGIGYGNLYYGSLDTSYLKYQPSNINGAYRHYSLIPFGTADFTIEGWFLYAGTVPYLSYADASDANAHAIRMTFGTEFGTMTTLPRLYDSGGSQFTNTGSGASNNFARYEWHHVALVREGTSCKTYVNGTLIWTTAVGTNSFSPTGVTLHAGNGADYGISDLQILLGTAKYTANFTPPTAEQGRQYQAES